jgi:hypothetical protein
MPHKRNSSGTGKAKSMLALRFSSTINHNEYDKNIRKPQNTGLKKARCNRLVELLITFDFI